MKKILVTILSVLSVVLLLATAVNAATVATFESNYMKDGDFVIASFNGVRNFIGDAKNPEPVENACYWLTDFKDAYNIEYVDFVGHMSSQANYRYNSKDKSFQGDSLIAKNEGDAEWRKDFELLWSTASILTDAGIPYGLTIGQGDLTANGMYRNNLVPQVFDYSDYVLNSDAKIYEYDANNYATIITVGEEEYIVYNLEVYPREPILNWFLEINAQHADKRAIVFTPSFLDANGEMLTQWNVSEGNFNNATRKKFTTNIMKAGYSENIINYDKPRDGEQLWSYALTKCDNLLCVVSSMSKTGEALKTKVLKNENGYDVLAVVANLEGSFDSAGKAYPVMIKISKDNKTIDVRFAAPYENGKGGYVKESQATVTLDNIANLPEENPLFNLPKISTQINGENKAYINGYANNIFKPNANMTKAEACTIIARLLTGTQQIPDGYTTKFTDVKESDWFFNAIAYLDSKGFFYDKSGKYEPNKNITRAEFAELAYRACNLEETKEVTFKDVNEKNPNYDAIMAAAAAGLINGYEDSTFRPNNNITRAEVVTIVNRVLGLYVDKVAIDKTHLDKIFSDITGHWAEYQILMASNDKVNSAAYYKADLDDVTVSGNEISFATKQLQVKINKKTGSVTGLINLETGENIVANSATPWFTYAISLSGSALTPKSMDLVNGRLKVSYRGGVTAYFIIETFDNYLTVTLDSDIPDTVNGIVFGNLSADYAYDQNDENSYAISGVAMNTNTDPLYYPGGSSKVTKGTVYTNIGSKYSNYAVAPTGNIHLPVEFGAKLGIAFSKQGVHREYLKEMAATIDPTVGLVSTHGGAFARDNDDFGTDYGIFLGSGSITTSNVESLAKLAQKHDYDIIDIHKGEGTFVQGDFNFVGIRTEEQKKNDVFVSAKTYKEKIIDVLEAHDVGASLHTFSSMVAPDAHTILSKPEYQKQLATDATTYTLRGDITKTKSSVKTYEDVSKVKVDTNYYSAYFLIDEEIIKVEKGSTSGFIGVTRGACGTKMANHKDGATIYHILGSYSALQPIPGSDLYYLVARNIAKTINQGGFKMLYLDAFESIKFCAWTNDNELFYWYSEFIREVLENCENDPIIETSANTYKATWGGITRSGQLDYATQDYKQNKGKQVSDRAIPLFKAYLGANIGWFHFGPDCQATYKNTQMDSIFRDDLDYVGTLAIAYDLTMVANPFSTGFYSYGQTNANSYYYSLYSRLRKAQYFAPEVKEQLKKGEYEYKLVELSDGSWAFQEMSYVEHVIYDTTDNIYLTGTANNPFSAQTPYIRIEQRYSTLSENEKLVYAFDETAEVTTLTGAKSVKLNLDSTQAFKIKVFGNGSETGAIAITLAGGDTIHYVVPTNFTGWREFIIMDSDPTYGKYNFSGLGTPRDSLTSFSSITKVTITTTGDCAGVKIDDLRAYTIVNAPVKNPSITIGGKTITFNTELDSSEYIEYYPDTNKAYLNYYEGGEGAKDKAHVKEITFTGSVSAPAGKVTFTYNSTPLTKAPTRAEVTIGFAGDYVKNPSTWVAPKVEIPEGIQYVTIF
ncbi:MAG: S-layer homology domain-containing protein [Ruminococcaceae bacterium]|nr:S-layer homology domain-containing protein [Oscillospiraceae bacterium]